MAATQINYKALGGLQPLVSDLVTTVAPKNKYLGQTYTADQQALQDRLNQYDAYNTNQFDGLKDYLSSKADAINRGQAYFKKGELNNTLSSLTGLSSDELKSAGDLLGGVNSIGTYGGNTIYNAGDLANKLGNYANLSAADAQDLFNRAGKSANLIGSLKGQNFYDKSALGGVYDAVPDAGTDVRGVKVLGGNLAAWTDPSGNYYDPRPVEAGKSYYGDPWGFSHEVQRVKGTPYYFIPKSNFDPTRSGTALTWYSPASTNGLYGYNYNGQEGLVFDPTKTSLSWTPGRNNDLYAEKKSHGLLSTLNDITNKFDPIGNFVTNTDAHMLGFDNRLDMVRSIGEPVGNVLGAVFSGGIPWGSILMAADNASTGNWKGVGNNAINGIASYAGSNIPSSSVAGTGYSLGSNAANAAANQALLSGAATALRGGNLNSILTNAALSGLGSYGGSTLGGYTSGMSPLAKIAANAAMSGGMSGLNAYLRGGNASQAMQSGALSGVTNSAIRTLLNNQLYKGQ